MTKISKMMVIAVDPCRSVVPRMRRRPSRAHRGMSGASVMVGPVSILARACPAGLRDATGSGSRRRGRAGRIRAAAAGEGRLPPVFASRWRGRLIPLGRAPPATGRGGRPGPAGLAGAGRAPEGRRSGAGQAPGRAPDVPRTAQDGRGGIAIDRRLCDAAA